MPVSATRNPTTRNQETSGGGLNGFRRDIDEWAGAASIKHRPTGLFAFTAFSFSDSNDSNRDHAGAFDHKSSPAMNAWDVRGGIQRDFSWFGLDQLGDTSLTAAWTGSIRDRRLRPLRTDGGVRASLSEAKVRAILEDDTGAVGRDLERRPQPARSSEGASNASATRPRSRRAWRTTRSARCSRTPTAGSGSAPPTASTSSIRRAAPSPTTARTRRTRPASRTPCCPSPRTGAACSGSAPDSAARTSGTR